MDLAPIKSSWYSSEVQIMNLCKQHMPIAGRNAHAHLRITTFVHVAKSINWARNSLVSSPFLSKDLCKQEAKHRISYLREAHLANIFM